VSDAREQRFREIAESGTPAVAAYLRRRLDPLTSGDLDDLIGEVLTVTWRRLDDVPAGYECPWMIGVAGNVLRNAKRARRRRQNAETSLQPSQPGDCAESAALAAADIREALSSLRPTEREVLLLHLWDGLDPAAIAVVLSTSERAIESRLARSRKKVRSALKRSERAATKSVRPVALAEE
jgi:RNA polymerase sigma-70 factor (ECF subfamily)